MAQEDEKDYYDGVDRRHDIVGRLQRDVYELKKDVSAIEVALQVGEATMHRLENVQRQQDGHIRILHRDLKGNTEVTNQIKTDTAQMLATFNNLIGFRKTCAWILGIIVAVSTGIVAFDTAYERVKGPLKPPTVVAPATGVPR